MIEDPKDRKAAGESDEDDDKVPPEESSEDSGEDIREDSGEETAAETETDSDATPWAPKTGSYDSEPTAAEATGEVPAAVDIDATAEQPAGSPWDQPAESEAPAPAPTKEKSGGGFGRFLVVMVVLGVLVGGAYVTWPYWGGAVKPYLPQDVSLPNILPDDWFRDDRVDGLAARIGGLEEAARARESAAADGRAAADLLAQRVGALEAAAEAGRTDAAAAQQAAVRDLEAERARAQAQVDALLRRVETLEQALKGVQDQVASLAARPVEAPAMAATGDGAVDRALGDMAARLARLESTAPAPAAPPPVDLAPLEARVAKLEAMAAQPAPPAADPAQVADLAARLAAVESRPVKRVDPARVGRVVAAVEALRLALRTDHPFAAELAELRAAAAGDAEVDKIVAPLEPRAATGVASLGDLTRRFDATRAAILSARADGGGDQGLVARTLDRLSNLVVIRRTDGAAPEGSAAAVVSQAGDSLAAGDLAAAVKTLDQLEGPAAEAAAPWLADARQRLAAERAMAALHVRAVSLMTGGSE